MLYAAYGSNLRHTRMLERCPGATPAGALLLPGWRLVLRRAADVEPDSSGLLPIGLWQVGPEHLERLDRAEGTALRVYDRRRVALPDGSGAWIYVGHGLRHDPRRLRADYVEHLRHGYRDFGLSPAPLEAALAACGFIG